MNKSEESKDRTGKSPQQEAIACARDLQSRGDFKAALAAWHEIRAAYPAAPAGYIGAATVLKKMKRNKEANDVLSEARQKLPGNERVAVEHAWAAHHAADWPEANRRWAEIRSQFPDSFAGYFGGGATLRALRRFDEAEQLYTNALPRWPEAANLFADHALLASERGDQDEAARRWGALRLRFPNEPAGYLQEVRQLRDSGKHDQAEEVLAAAARALPRRAVSADRIRPHRSATRHPGRGAEALGCRRHRLPRPGRRLCRRSPRP